MGFKNFRNSNKIMDKWKSKIVQMNLLICKIAKLLKVITLRIAIKKL